MANKMPLSPERRAGQIAASLSWRITLCDDGNYDSSPSGPPSGIEVDEDILKELILNAIQEAVKEALSAKAVS